MLEIAAVLPGSTAERCGLRKGDRLVSVNGREVRDSIDVSFLAAEERLSLEVERPDGTRSVLRLLKEPDDSLGIELPPLNVRRCRNRCIFCFVDQMPPGCRKSLSVKDDDYRASFLFGNYITLGNLRAEDWERIFRQRLSPLYVSVHATEPELRSFLLQNRRAPDIRESLRRLAAGGIALHTQIVLCPGINDGEHLVRTIGDLASLAPAVRSIAVAPVGLTRRRQGLFPLRPFRRNEARMIVKDLETMGRRFRKRLGARLVFPSDELYLRASLPLPRAAFYEDFPQIENGVGMVAEFLRTARRARVPSRLPKVRATAVTGESFAPVLRAALQRLRNAGGPVVQVLKVRNAFLGPSVTVAGLLAGRDIVRAVRKKQVGEILFLPATALKEGSGVFIDDLSLRDLEKASGARVAPVHTLADLLQELSRAGERGQG